jgi:Flp pilus assembly pilin Flp
MMYDFKTKSGSLSNPADMGRKRRRFSSRRGQTLVEYALILAFVSVVAISILVAVGTNTKAVYSTINSQISKASATH